MWSRSTERQPRGRGRLRSRLTYANVVSTLALFITLAGGSAYAASKLITGKQIAPGTITAKNIKHHSLLKLDFATGQLPAGPQGPVGGTGPQGPQGAAGTARAWGIIATSGTTGNASFTAQSGFPGAPLNPSTGVYCIPAPAGAQNEGVVLTAQAGEAEFLAQATPNQCGTSNDYEVLAGDSTGTLTNEPFNIVVP